MSRASLLLGVSEIVVDELTNAFEREVDAIAHDAAFTGVEFVRHSAQRRHRSLALALTLDREGGVDVALCERIAGRINAALAAYRDRYTLEVESAGLERPLVQPRDYERFAGKAARVLTTLSIRGGKTHRGILRGVRGTNVMLDTPQGELPLPLATIKSARLEFDPRADFTRDKRERKNHA
jgi:ribosome maturation factor RimP